jgi:anti-sigma factor RsiW
MPARRRTAVVSDRAAARAGGPSPAPAPDELDLACRDVVELVSHYLDGCLDPPLAAARERHLALCPACIEYVRQLRQTIALLGHLPEETHSERARTELLVAFRGLRRPEPCP